MELKRVVALLAAGIMLGSSSSVAFAAGNTSSNRANNILGTTVVSREGISHTGKFSMPISRIGLGMPIIEPPVIIEPPPPPVIGTGLSPIIYLLHSDRFKEWANKKAEEEGREIPYPEVRDSSDVQEESSSNLEESGDDFEDLPQWLRDFASFSRKYLNPIIMV